MIVSEHVTDAAVVISTEPPVSQNVRVNLADLFDRVVLAPGTSQWVVDVVTRCIRDAGVGCPVEPSTLDQPPKF